MTPSIRSSSRKSAVSSVIVDLISRSDWSGVKEHLEKEPKDASVIINTGFGNVLPLHEACKSQPPSDVIEALLAANESAVRVKGQWGYLPLHLACKSGASADVIEILTKAYPGSLRVRDDDGKLPLHLACEWGAAPEVVNLILINYPESIYVHDLSGKSAKAYAEANNRITSNKAQVMDVLELSPAYCAVSKAAVLRAQQEFDIKMKGVNDANSTHVANLEKVHYSELNIRYKSEEDLRTALNDMIQLIQDLRKDSSEYIDELINNAHVPESERTKVRDTLEKEKQKAEFLYSDPDTGGDSRATATKAAVKKFAGEARMLQAHLKIRKAREDTQNLRMSKLEEVLKETQEDLKVTIKYCEELKHDKKDLKRNLDSVSLSNSQHIKKLEDCNSLVAGLASHVHTLVEEQKSLQAALARQDAALWAALKSRQAVSEQIFAQGERMAGTAVELEKILDVLPSDKNKINGGSAVIIDNEHTKRLDQPLPSASDPANGEVPIEIAIMHSDTASDDDDETPMQIH